MISLDTLTVPLRELYLCSQVLSRFVWALFLNRLQISNRLLIGPYSRAQLICERKRRRWRKRERDQERRGVKMAHDKKQSPPVSFSVSLSQAAPWQRCSLSTLSDTFVKTKRISRLMLCLSNPDCGQIKGNLIWILEYRERGSEGGR